jgi:hypothetical protein
MCKKGTSTHSDDQNITRTSVLQNKCPGCEKIEKGSTDIQDMFTIQRASEKH